MKTCFSPVFPVGAVVQSVRGRDRYRCYIVCGVCDDAHLALVYLADGVRRTPEAPKIKNVKHLRFLGTAENPSDILQCPEKIAEIVSNYDPINNSEAVK